MKLLKKIKKNHSLSKLKEGMIISNLKDTDGNIDPKNYLIEELIHVGTERGMSAGDIYPAHYEEIIRPLDEIKYNSKKKLRRVSFVSWMTNGVIGLDYIGSFTKEVNWK